MVLGLGGIVNLPRGDGITKTLTIVGGELGRVTSRRCWKLVREFEVNLQDSIMSNVGF
jgi:hypothetical protein